MRSLAAALRRIKERNDPIARFFRKDYAGRVAEIQALYNHEFKRHAIARAHGTDYFTRPVEQAESTVRYNPRYFYDVMLGYTRVLKPPSVMQLGCFVVEDLQWLALRGYAGRMIGTDFSREHLDYLRSELAGTVFNGIEFRPLDLEQCAAADFEGADMVVALSVLSNIQPEGLARFFAEIARSDVRLLAIGDVYTDASMTGDPGRPSIAIRNSRNWFHCYRALARANGFECVFVPDFCFYSFGLARGIFILHRGLPPDLHAAALADAGAHYLQRQEALWDRYSYTTEPRHEAAAFRLAASAGPGAAAGPALPDTAREIA